MNTDKIWFTSDTHFGHSNIIKYCDRPFNNADHMDEILIDNWNSVVSPGDLVYHLGDVALGDINKSLAKVGRLNGRKHLILGNHDRPFMRYGKSDYQHWENRYYEVFDFISISQVLSYTPEMPLCLSHFPYDGDHTVKDRYKDYRLLDEGVSLMHGHTHSKETITYSKAGTPQIHVGVDAWDFTPVNLTTIMEILDND